mmetsp:Transcript_23055/g.52429  ORF Transcript_23055/g.52429 Transcript_23055/m.52429 type:complete len:212 (+) Transcript_23055:398-1033(+)
MGDLHRGRGRGGRLGPREAEPTPPSLPRAVDRVPTALLDGVPLRWPPRRRARLGLGCHRRLSVCNRLHGEQPAGRGAAFQQRLPSLRQQSTGKRLRCEQPAGIGAALQQRLPKRRQQSTGKRLRGEEPAGRGAALRQRLPGLISGGGEVFACVGPLFRPEDRQPLCPVGRELLLVQGRRGGRCGLQGEGGDECHSPRAAKRLWHRRARAHL